MVSRAADDGDTGRQAHDFLHLFAGISRDFHGVVDLGQPVGIDAELLQLVGQPDSLVDIVAAALCSPVQFQRSGAGELINNVVVGAHDGPGLGPVFRLMLLDPQQTGNDVLLVGGAAGQLVELLLIQSSGDFLDLLDGAGVILLNGVTDRLAILVQHHDCRNHAAGADADDLIQTAGDLLADVPDGFHSIAPPDVGPFFCPVAVQGQQVVGSGGFRYHLTAGRQQNGLDGSRADIDTKYIFFHV